ncbi:hypothetical protein VFPPC_11945 [Pochonia chlamydosporia 170]|uniref:DUF3626 domain-containing protein n=1 Tax=Pochonia chlamydosporia 170 TaxID=1380566 RepID=A0A179FX27_METCM|nr:hypothetical protein VFPPC_11945 [Pochonia chlamydosporia 170]OAQ69613.1 hypothetical protein VFPPC_11945 [Pochonia chlamydosporia 170]
MDVFDANNDEDVVALLPCQEAALASIKRQANALEPDATETIAQIMRMSNIESSKLHTAKEAIRKHARIALHFHPDRPAGEGTVATSLLHDGVYRNQFETGISNGLVAAFRGSLRDNWENNLFENAYGDHAVSLCHRPKYGALDLTNFEDGPAARFGSCYFLLKPAVATRSTFTFGGSQAAPKYRATADQFEPILAALLEETFTRDFMLGISGIRPAQAVQHLCQLPKFKDDGPRTLSRNLDHMIEAQIHGDVLLGRDVDTLVIDGAFRGTAIGHCLEQIGHQYRFPVRYRQSFQLDVRDVPLDFRGPSMPLLAKRISQNSIVTTATLGEGAQDLRKHPEAWTDRGTYAEVLQEFKLLWHILVRYG